MGDMQNGFDMSSHARLVEVPSSGPTTEARLYSSPTSCVPLPFDHPRSDNLPRSTFLGHPDDDVVEIPDHGLEPAGVPRIRTRADHFRLDERFRRGDDDPDEFGRQVPFREGIYMHARRPPPILRCCECAIRVPPTYTCAYAAQFCIRRKYSWRAAGRQHALTCDHEGNHYVCNNCGYFDPDYERGLIGVVCPCCVRRMRWTARPVWDGILGYDSTFKCCTCGINVLQRQKCCMDGQISRLGRFEDHQYNAQQFHHCPNYTCLECGFTDPRYPTRGDGLVCEDCFFFARYFFYERWNGTRYEDIVAFA